MNAGLKPFLIAVLLRGDIGCLVDDDDAVARSAIANDDNAVGVMAAVRLHSVSPRRTTRRYLFKRIMG